jgi:hypothetical protein
VKSIFIFLVSLTSIKTLVGQKNIKRCVDSIAINISYARLGSDEDVVQDSLQKEVKLVFEQDFNDTIAILLNDSLFTTGVFKTKNNLGVSLNIISIDYSKFEKVPRISIVLISKNDCESFYPRVGKRLAYINRIEGAWSIALSNALREYK